MNYKPNRLQFVHCDTCFENSAKAREYVNGNLIVHDRPALYAEPMVLKYGDPKNPNILLAIGSVGDGQTTSVDNKVFFIDCAQLDIKSNLEFIDSNTISFNINKTDSGTTIEPSIQLEESKIIDKKIHENVILNEPNGLFTHISTELVGNDLLININGNISSYTLSSPIVRGEYNKEKLLLTLFNKDNEPITVDFKNVVLVSDNDNNIIKKTEDGLYAQATELLYDKLSNVLTFNNGLEEKQFNILSHEQDTFNKQITAGLQSLKITPVDTNSIKNTVQTTSNGTTLESNVNLSVDATNILKLSDGGIYANVDIDYDSALNKLIFSTTSGQKEINLVTQSFLESISYDSIQKKIILKVKLNDNNVVTQEINVEDLFNPINVENDFNSPITLSKVKNENTGIDTIKAQLHVAAGENNLIKLQTEGSTANLFASNHAKDIKVDWYAVDAEGNITDPQFINVQEAFIKVSRYFDINDINSNLFNEELEDAKKRIQVLENQVADLINYVNKLTDFGYTDKEENA